jgi:hypothetical protein
MACIRASSLALGFLLAVSACKKDPAQTTVPATWRNPELSGAPFSTMFVVGVARNEEYRRLYEDHMVHALESEGAAAQQSSAVFPTRDQLEPARVLVEAKKRGFDAVVVARLQSVQTEKEFVPARPLTSSDLYMSGYDPQYAVNSDPAHFKDTTTYRIQTSVYSIRDEMVAWVALSDTVDPESVEDVIESLSKRIAQTMKAEGLIQ